MHLDCSLLSLHEAFRPCLVYADFNTRNSVIIYSLFDMWQKVEENLFFFYFFSLPLKFGCYRGAEVSLNKILDLCSFVYNRCSTCSESDSRTCIYNEVCISVLGLSKEASLFPLPKTTLLLRNTFVLSVLVCLSACSLHFGNEYVSENSKYICHQIAYTQGGVVSK